jgi:hypothetical protein
MPRIEQRINKIEKHLKVGDHKPPRFFSGTQEEDGSIITTHGEVYKNMDDFNLKNKITDADSVMFFRFIKPE